MKINIKLILKLNLNKQILKYNKFKINKKDLAKNKKW